MTRLVCANAVGRDRESLRVGAAAGADSAVVVVVVEGKKFEKVPKENIFSEVTHLALL